MDNKTLLALAVVILAMVINFFLIMAISEWVIVSFFAGVAWTLGFCYLDSIDE